MDLSIDSKDYGGRGNSQEYNLLCIWRFGAGGGDDRPMTSGADGWDDFLLDHDTFGGNLENQDTLLTQMTAVAR